MADTVITTVYLFAAGGWRRRYLICVPILLLPFLGLAAGKMLAKTYEARMTLLLQEPASLNPFLKDFSVATNIQDRMAGLISLARSEHILGAVVRDLKLVADDTGPVQVNRVVKDLAANLQVQLIGADLVELRLRGGRPDSLDKILSTIGNRFIDRMLAPERSSIDNSVDFLESQMAEQRRTLEEAERLLAEFKVRNANRLPAVFGTNVQQLFGLRQTLQAKQTELEGTDAAFEDLRARLVSTNPVIGQIEDSVVRLTAEVALLRARYTDEHSEVQAALRKLRRLQDEKVGLIATAQSIGKGDLDRLWNLSASGGNATRVGDGGLLVSQMERLQEAQAKGMALRSEIGQLQTSVSNLETAIKTHGAVEQELQALERQVAAQREVFDGLNKRYAMARVTRHLGSFEAPERLKIIEAPSVPTVPITPSAALFVMGGLAAGVILGLGLAVLAEMTDMRLKSRRRVEECTGAEVLSRMPAVRA